LTSGKHPFFYQAIFFLFSLVLALAAGEVFIRLVYWDGGSQTSGGPGNKKFEYLFSEEGKRGPTVKNPQGPGVTRILVQGDSITFGAGVKDWKDLYPYRLLRLLNQSGKAYDMEVLAEAGWEIDSHRYHLSQNGERLHPDVIIYQWYINDLEIQKEGRPVNGFLFWRNIFFHETLMKYSFLYNFLDKKLENLVPSSNRTYAQYIIEDYADKTPGWYLFDLEFHNWATLAKVYAPRRILMLYPSLPYKGEYPFKPINDRVAKLSEANRVTFPVVWSDKGVGEEVGDTGSYLGTSFYVSQGKTPTGIVFSTPPIYLEKGNHQVLFRLKGNRLDNKGEIKLKVIAEDRLVGEKTVGRKDFVKEGVWEEVKLPFSLDQAVQDKIRFQADYLGQGDFGFDCVQLPVDYGLEIIDLLPYLKDIKTHASPFDAHPNPKTHQIMAEVLYRYLTQRPNLLPP
jgi:hypothetical protein